jgi:hypothetical protein
MCIVKMPKAFLDFICSSLSKGSSNEIGDTHLHSLAWLASPIRAVLALRAKCFVLARYARLGALPSLLRKATVSLRSASHFVLPQSLLRNFGAPKNRARAQLPIHHITKQKIKRSTIRCQLLRYAQCVQKTEPTRSVWMQTLFARVGVPRGRS